MTCPQLLHRAAINTKQWHSVYKQRAGLWTRPSTDKSQTWYAKVEPILSRSVYSVAFGRRKTRNITGFRTFAFCDVANWRCTKKLNTAAQLQIFPYPTVSKSFLYSNSFVTKSYAETPSFKSVTDTQTDKQKTQRFRAPPNLAWW